jgi:hypothetical protein
MDEVVTGRCGTLASWISQGGRVLDANFSSVSGHSGSFASQFRSRLNFSSTPASRRCPSSSVSTAGSLLDSYGEHVTHGRSEHTVACSRVLRAVRSGTGPTDASAGPDGAPSQKSIIYVSSLARDGADLSREREAHEMTGLLARSSGPRRRVDRAPLAAAVRPQGPRASNAAICRRPSCRSIGQIWRLDTHAAREPALTPPREPLCAPELSRPGSIRA